MAYTVNSSGAVTTPRVMTSNGTTVAAASATSAKTALSSSVVEMARAMRARAAARGACAAPGSCAAAVSAVPRTVIRMALGSAVGLLASLPQGADDRLGRLTARELLLARDQIAVAHSVAAPQSRLDVVRSQSLELRLDAPGHDPLVAR